MSENTEKTVVEEVKKTSSRKKKSKGKKSTTYELQPKKQTKTEQVDGDVFVDAEKKEKKPKKKKSNKNTTKKKENKKEEVKIQEEKIEEVVEQEEVKEVKEEIKEELPVEEVKEEVVEESKEEIKEEAQEESDELPILENIERDEDDLDHTQRIETINDTLPSDTRIGTITEDMNKARFYHRLFNPIFCVKKACEEWDFSFVKAFLRTFFKYGLAVLIYIDMFSNALNRVAFSYARMTFSDSAWLWFRVVTCGVVGELIIYIVLTIGAKLLKKKTSFKRIFYIQSETALSITLVFILCGLLAYVNTAYGFIGFIVASVYSLACHHEAGKRGARLSAMQETWLYVLGFALAAFWALYFIRFVGSDIAQIFDLILNI